jgi:hypothetical protein
MPSTSSLSVQIAIALSLMTIKIGPAGVEKEGRMVTPIPQKRSFALVPEVF